MDVRFGDFTLKGRERRLIGPAGTVDLGARSVDILLALLARPGELLSKDELFHAGWPGMIVEENTLQVHVAQLRKVIGPSMIATLHGRGYRYEGPAPAMVAVSATPIAPVTSDRKPVIAVLPFSSHGADAEQQYFSDGISEDIIDRLTKYRILSVIGHHSSFAMRGHEAESAEVRKMLAADYVVTGSVRKSESRIRIAARLTETASGAAIWAEHYDRPLEDIFAVQDEVAALIASTLMGRVEAETAARNHAPGRDVSSYEHVLQGIWHFKKLTVEDNERAATHFRNALAINPANAEAMRWLSSYYMNLWFMDHERNQLEKSVELARRAADLDPASAMCHTALGLATLWYEGCAGAEPIYRKAFQANPGDPNVLAEMALLHIYSGNLDKAFSLLDEAERLNPLPPLWYAEFRGIAAFVMRRYADALPAFAAVPECVFDTTYVMACLGHMDDRKRTALVMQRVRERNWNLVPVAEDEPFCDPQPRLDLIAGVRKALDFGL